MHRISTILRLLKGDGDLIFFYAFLFSFPFGWRKVLVPNWMDPSGLFNEYMDVSIYVSEIFLVIAYILIILNNINIISSILISFRTSARKLFHVEHKWIMFSLGILLVYMGISVVWSQFQLFSIIAFTHLILLAGLIPYLIYRVVPRGTITFNEIGWILLFSSIIQVILITGQVSLSESLGLRILNEPIISSQALNVAKVLLPDTTFLRGYGTQLHPNVAGSLLLIYCLLMLILYRKKMFHVEHTIFYLAQIWINLGILLTFSKMAIIGLFLGMIWICSTWNIRKRVAIMCLTLILALTGLVGWLGYSQSQSLSDRVFYLKDQFPSIVDHFILGVGYGASSLLHEEKHEHALFWEMQPIHNIWLVAIQEIGLIGVILLLILIGAMAYVPRGTSKPFLPILGVIILLGVGDHYFWDIYQGQVLFWLGLSFAIYIDKN